MKDQCSLTPKQVIDGIDDAQKHLDCIFSVIERIAKNNGKLNEVIEDSADFYKKFFKFQDCLDEIQSEVEEMPTDSLITEYELQDKINTLMYDNSLSGRG